MILYLIRHAEAVRVGGSIQRDADRMLTQQGEQDSVLMGRALTRVEPSPGIVVTSPLTRAVQTGQLIAHEICHSESRATENLAPGFRHKDLLEEILSVAGEGNIVVVGHQPDMGAFLSYLISDSARAFVVFPPAAMAKVSVPASNPAGESTLHWILTPETVRHLHPQL